MRQLMLFASALLFLVGCGSSSDSNKTKTTNPTIREAFRSKYELANASFESSVARVAQSKANLSSIEFDLVKKQIRELSEIIPIQGFSEPFVLDGQYISYYGFRLNLEDTYARVDKVSIWVLCKSSQYITDVTLFGATMKAGANLSYAYGKDGYFPYDKYSPQLSATPNTVVETKAYVSGAVGEGCSHRVLVNYSLISRQTAAALATWRAELTGILEDLRDLGYHTEPNYPYEFALRQIKTRLANAFAALP